MKISIASERPEHVSDIHGVNSAAFGSSAEADLVDALRAAGRLTLSLVACFEDAVVGHVAFSPVTIDGVASDSPGLGLGPIAVLPQHQRQGIGNRLIRDGLDACERLNCPFVVLLGEPRYYSRFGFRPASEWGLDSEYDAGDAFMALELSAGGIPLEGGLVRYAPEFGGLTS